MKDAISEKRVSELHPLVRGKFKAFIEACESRLGITLRVVQGLRTFPEQQALYEQGRSTRGPIVTNAKAGSSYHNYGLAVDLAQLLNGKINWDFNYSLIQPIAREFGLVWGADWDNDGKTKAQGDKDEHLVDMPHFELTFGYNWRVLLQKYNAGEFIEGTHYVKMNAA